MFPNSSAQLMNPFLEDKFDDRFKALQNQLHWLPWVGKDYLKCPLGKKLLIVGESHYVPLNENAEDGYNDETWTRMFILKEGLKQSPWYSGNPISPLINNTEKVIFWDDNEATDEFKRKLWSSVAYFNIIQRLLNSKDFRPSKEDWQLGWRVFLIVVEILLPDIVLFCGVEASNQRDAFDSALLDYNYNNDGIKRYTKIGNTYPRTTTISHDEKNLPLIFIKHPSMNPPIHSWAEFIFNHISDYLKWICSES